MAPAERDLHHIEFRTLKLNKGQTLEPAAIEQTLVDTVSSALGEPLHCNIHEMVIQSDQVQLTVMLELVTSVIGPS